MTAYDYAKKFDTVGVEKLLGETPVERNKPDIKRKDIMLPTICKKFNVKSNNIAYIGDDVNDVKIMKLVGLSAVPFNGTKEVKLISDFKCKKRGGEGAFREFAELLISESGFHLKK